jgi:hypothetical protein
MTRSPIPCLALCLFSLGCSETGPTEQYGFLARLGQDTISLERVARYPGRLVSEEVDRFPEVRQRHTEITLAPDGSLRRMDMRVRIPSAQEPRSKERRIVADFTSDTVRVALTDDEGRHTIAMATDGLLTIPHVPQMYSLLELYFAAAIARATADSLPAGGIVTTRQFYPDREFSNYPVPMHRGYVRPGGDGRVQIQHNWLAGTGTAILDSNSRMLSYSGARTTYLVEVTRLAEPPDVETIGGRFASDEQARGALSALSLRDTVHARIGNARFTVDYGRPLARGRTLLGGVIPYDNIWRTGANEATQFSTSVPIKLGGIALPAGTYTLWTLPRQHGVSLIVNRQTGQWGTRYDSSEDIGTTPLAAVSSDSMVEKFTISVAPSGERSGVLALAWGPFRWTAGIAVE